jgi:hypothetical protein
LFGESLVNAFNGCIKRPGMNIVEKHLAAGPGSHQRNACTHLARSDYPNGLYGVLCHMRFS